MDKGDCMQTQQINLHFVDLINNWDPFDIGSGHYDPEIADIVQAVHALDNEEILARKIQAIFEFSFEEIIPLEKCSKIANELLNIKNNGICTL